MPSSVVRTFTDPDDYASSIRQGTVELTITERRQFTAKLIGIQFHRLRMQRFFDNLPRVANTVQETGRAFFSFLSGPGPGNVSKAATSSSTCSRYLCAPSDNTMGFGLVGLWPRRFSIKQLYSWIAFNRGGRSTPILGGSIGIRTKRCSNPSSPTSRQSGRISIVGRRRQCRTTNSAHGYDLTDYTNEQLAEILCDNPRGILVLMDEIMLLFGGFDAYKAGKVSRDRPVTLEGYNGGPRDIDRKSSKDDFDPRHFERGRQQIVG
jgi:hypothetical protein